jgi:EAL domain-containing protein (putative c-di-GMP-specific phosphodiesterase class I)
VQGYFFSPPRPAKDVAALLAGRDARADGLRKAG